MLNNSLWLTLDDPALPRIIETLESWKLHPEVLDAHCSSCTQKKLRNPCYEIGYCTEDISTGATLVYFCLQQHVLLSQSMR
jgi:hypothetical protein